MLQAFRIKTVGLVTKIMFGLLILSFAVWGIGEALSKTADQEALEFMGFQAGARVEGTRIDVAFIGSCTNGRLSDLEEAAKIVRGRHVASHVKALVVPGSQAVRRAAEATATGVARRRYSESGHDRSRAAAQPSRDRTTGATPPVTAAPNETPPAPRPGGPRTHLNFPARR